MPQLASNCFVIFVVIRIITRLSSIESQPKKVVVVVVFVVVVVLVVVLVVVVVGLVVVVIVVGHRNLISKFGQRIQSLFRE